MTAAPRPQARGSFLNKEKGWTGIKNHDKWVAALTLPRMRDTVREVAQPGRAQRSGRWGRRFESSLPDQ